MSRHLWPPAPPRARAPRWLLRRGSIATSRGRAPHRGHRRRRWRDRRPHPPHRAGARWWSGAAGTRSAAGTDGRAAVVPAMAGPAVVSGAAATASGCAHAVTPPPAHGSPRYQRVEELVQRRREGTVLDLVPERSPGCQRSPRSRTTADGQARAGRAAATAPPNPLPVARASAWIVSVIAFSIPGVEAAGGAWPPGGTRAARTLRSRSGTLAGRSRGGAAGIAVDPRDQLCDVLVVREASAMDLRDASLDAGVRVVSDVEGDEPVDQG